MYSKHFIQSACHGIKGIGMGACMMSECNRTHLIEVTSAFCFKPWRKEVSGGAVG